MHVQCAFVHVPHVAQSIACCVIAEFIHGVQPLLMMKHILLCAASVLIPPVEVLISRCTMFR